ncbi:hypothetical protein ELOC111193_05340 [Elizabethkingia occulta]|uniref:Uncharacterized protein n=1 Tax=Elizabethkingia occulta TaxID=1867263 RepID=A0A1T3MMC0_9FLAO|nr:hypothetical protein [Elizabethkingia occulta]OPB96597.1 hypothetical protein BB020_16170 [Elizabethkingia occulta]OPC65793.1 hypothetical protein BAZ10_00705 [Elizabethkingia occulta]
MKKQAINKKLLFKKEIVKDLKSVTGGDEPETMPVNSYACGDTYRFMCTTPDPLPNLDTCICGTGGFNDTLNACHTKHGVTCVLNTVVNCTTP